MKPVRIAVIGVGYIGSRHARKVASLAESSGEVTLAGVADIDFRRASQQALRLRTLAASDGRDLHSLADAAIVAVPTVAHFDVVRDALERGLDVLVEKPMAASIREGEELISVARSGGRLLQVGHIEHFNAVMPAIREHIDHPRFIEAHRLGPFTERAADVDVVRDLMIHDIDIVQQLLGEAPRRVEAVGVPVVTDKVDVAHARLEFPGGCVASLTASRVSPTPTRKLRVYQRDAFFAIDFLEQSASLYRPAEGEIEVDAEENATSSGIGVEELKIDPEDAMETQLRAFVRAVRTRKQTSASGADGLGALRTALRVFEAMSFAHEEP